MFEEIVTKNGLKFNNLEKKIYKFCRGGTKNKEEIEISSLFLNLL